MISGAELRKTAEGVLGRLSSDIDFDSAADMLLKTAEQHGVALTSYGYVMWLVEHYGHKSAYGTLIGSANVMNDYALAAVNFRDDMPSMLINAHEYVSKILTNIPDTDVCLMQLEGMTFPYVLYVLFAGSDSADVVARYRPEMEEQMKRYPSTLDRLPETYRAIGKEFTDADTDET